MWWVKLEEILFGSGNRSKAPVSQRMWVSGLRNHLVQICISCSNKYYKYNLSLDPRPYKTKQEDIGWESFLPKVCIIFEDVTQTG